MISNKKKSENVHIELNHAHSSPSQSPITRSIEPRLIPSSPSDFKHHSRASPTAQPTRAQKLRCSRLLNIQRPRARTKKEKPINHPLCFQKAAPEACNSPGGPLSATQRRTPYYRHRTQLATTTSSSGQLLISPEILMQAVPATTRRRHLPAATLHSLSAGRRKKEPWP